MEIVKLWNRVRTKLVRWTALCLTATNAAYKATAVFSVLYKVCVQLLHYLVLDIGAQPNGKRSPNEMTQVGFSSVMQC